MGVDQQGFKGEDKAGFYERTMRVKATGQVVTDQVKVNEEDGEIVYIDPGSNEERVAAVVLAPLRIEMYKRDSKTKMRCEWTLPYKAAVDTVNALVNFAKEIEDNKSDTIGYGMHSAGLSANADDLWKAMTFFVFNPDKCGLAVDQLALKEQQGFVFRSMRAIPTNRVLTENIRVNEGAREIVFRSVDNGAEHDHERVFALRSEPLRFELHKRCSKNEMKLSWNQPTVLGQKTFDAVLKTAGQNTSSVDSTARIQTSNVGASPQSLPSFASSVLNSPRSAQKMPGGGALPTFAAQSMKR
jgi:hypothetical protein